MQVTCFRRGGLRAALLATGGALALGAPAVHAREAADVASLPEVVVTASKRAENIQVVPASITAVGEQLVQRLHANNLGDVGPYVPGLNVQASGGDANRLVIRGLSTGPNDLSPSVGVYIDDAPFGATSGFALGAFFSPDVDPFDLERIEVLRGPQGTLYGASTLSGLVKYVTKEPDATRYSGHVRLDYGQDSSTGAAQYTARAGLDAPLVKDKVALRVSGYYSKTNGTFTDVRTGAGDLNEVKRHGGRAELLLKPTDDLKIKLSGMFADSDIPNTGSVTADARTLQPIYGANAGFVAVPHLGIRSYYSVLQANVVYTLPHDLTVSSTTSYSHFKVNENSDTTETFRAALGPVLGSLLQFSTPADPNTRKFTEEVRLASPSTGKLEWLGGFFFDREENTYMAAVRSVYGYGATPPAVLAPTVGLLANYQTALLNTRYIEYAGFGNVTYHLTSSFDVGAGVRYSKNQQHYVRNVSGYLVLIGAAPAFAQGTSEDGVWTESFDARWHVQPHAMVYARAARGYRPGGPNPVGGPFGPDTTWNYELGYKASALDGRLQADASAFYIDWDNVQLNFFNGTNTIIGNAGGARSEGFEGEMTFAPVKDLILAANLAYTDATMTSLKPGAQGGAVLGDELPFNSKWTGALRADYYFPLASRLEGNVGASLRYRSSFGTTFPGDTGTRYYKLPQSTFVDLRGGVAVAKRVNVDQQVLNLLDSRKLIAASEYLAVPAATADALGQRGVIAYAPGRTYSVSLTAAF